MGGGGDRDRKPTLDRYSTVESKKLYSNLPLVVVHCHVGIVLVAFQEDSITGVRAVCVDALRACLLNGRTNGVNLLSPESPVLTVVRIQCADTQSRVFNARFPSVTRVS